MATPTTPGTPTVPVQNSADEPTGARQLNSILNWGMLVATILAFAIAFMTIKRHAETQETFLPSANVPNAATGTGTHP